VTERTANLKSSRRDVLKLAGVAALGAAGASAISAVKVKAAGSGATIAWVANPQHLTSGHLAAGAEVAIGPFLFPGSTFDSTNYYGIVGNLTARRWKGNGWMSVRPNGMPFVVGSQAINLNFGGHFQAWSNWFICPFGFDNPGHTSDGMFIIRNGPAPADYLVDLHGFMDIDQ
jgi:hypothetical protein